MSIRIEKRGEDLVLIGCHNKPIAKAEPDGIRIHARHDGGKCEPLIGWEELERLKAKVLVTNLKVSQVI